MPVVSGNDIFLRDFLVIRKNLLQNYEKNLEEMFTKGWRFCLDRSEKYEPGVNVMNHFCTQWKTSSFACKRGYQMKKSKTNITR